MCLEEKRFKTISELSIGLDILCPWGGGGRSQWWQMFLPLLTSSMIPEAHEQGQRCPVQGVTVSTTVPLLQGFMA